MYLEPEILWVPEWLGIFENIPINVAESHIRTCNGWLIFILEEFATALSHKRMFGIFAFVDFLHVCQHLEKQHEVLEIQEIEKIAKISKVSIAKSTVNNINVMEVW